MKVTPAKLIIREFSEELSVRVTSQRQFGRAIATLIAGVVFIGLWAHSTSKSDSYLLMTAAICVLLVLKNIISALRGTSVELRVNQFELISHGHAPEDYGSSIVARADVFNLEYREASGGGDFPELPEGLYAEHQSSGLGLLKKCTCILPHLDQAQAEQVTQVIYRRFPDTGKLSSAGGVEPYLTSLNLGPPHQD